MSTDNQNAKQLEAKAKQLLGELEEPYRSQALENFDPIFFKIIPFDEFTKSKALLCAFRWSGTPQGHFHWEKLCHELKEKEIAEQNTTPQQ
jgi:hypothetical protein